MTNSVGGWEIVRELPGGAQAKVHVVRSSRRVREIADNIDTALVKLQALSTGFIL